MENPFAPRAHFRPRNGWIGDLHPVFHDGTWHLYGLEIPLEPLRAGLSRLRSVEIASRDLLRWKPHPIVHHGTRRDWWAIASLWENGKLYSFYNSAKGFDLSISDDGKHWHSILDNPVIPYPTGGELPELAECRDPFVFRDPASHRYYMIVAGKKKQASAPHLSGIYLYATSDDLRQWSKLRVLYDPGNIGIPECPEMFVLNDRYYLVGSWGVDRVGQARWRVADTPTGQWRKPEHDEFDGAELMAPNSASDGTRRLLFGWIPTYQGRQDFAPYEWGGHLAFPREMYADAEGNLCLRAPKELDKLRGKKLPLPMPDETTRLFGSSSSLEARRGVWNVQDGLPQEETVLHAAAPVRFDLSLMLSFTSQTERVGIILSDAAPEDGYAVVVDRKRSRLQIVRRDKPDTPLAETPIRINSKEMLPLRVMADGEIVEVFWANRYALAARLQKRRVGAKLSVFCEGGVRAEHITLHELKAIFPEHESQMLPLVPADASAFQGQGGVLFGQTGANTYTPYSPALRPSGSFTLECRFWTTPGTSGFKANLLAMGDLPWGYVYGLNLTAEGGLELYYKTASGYEGLASPAKTFAAEARWITAAATVDLEQKEIRLYRDGKLVAQKSIEARPIDPALQGALRLGCAAGLPECNPFYGMIQWVRVWNTPRTSAQIKASAPTLELHPDGLLIHWDFRGGSFQTPEKRTALPNLAPEHSDLSAILFDGARLFP